MTDTRSPQRLAAPTPTSVAAALPRSLRLGAATSSYQIEGAVEADGRARSIWDTFAADPAHIADHSSGRTATGHYQRMRDDVDLMAWLGLQAYRFSVAWPRVIPCGRGPVNARGLDFYDRLVDALLHVGIEPVVTLYHWDLPQALEDEGGWTRRDTAEAFGEYADVVASRLGDRVTRWLTLNEPWCSAFLGYHVGRHAPGRTDEAAATAAAWNLLVAHRMGAQAVGAAVPGAVIGAALNLTTVRPLEDDDIDAAHLVDGVRNRWWLDGMVRGTVPEDVLEAWSTRVDTSWYDADDLAGAPPLDLLGINYYTPEVVTTGGPTGAGLAEPALPGIHPVPPEGDLTAMGWAVDPDALRDLLLRVTAEYGPVRIAITENGAAYPDPDPVDGAVDDTERTAYIAEHLRAVAQACAAGAQVSDYFVWSLLDNFEWGHGYTKRFGIVHVDYDSLRRTPKASAHWYRELIRAHGDEAPDP